LHHLSTWRAKLQMDLQDYIASRCGVNSNRTSQNEDVSGLL